jgi:hypothetical protein
VIDLLAAGPPDFPLRAETAAVDLPAVFAAAEEWLAL